MTIKGLSTNRRTASSAACLLANGYSFAFRYYSVTTQMPEKRLTPKEAAEIARAGVDIAVVYQDRARRIEDFGAARGAKDAGAAFVAAGQIGQPVGSAIYFAVDVDFSKQEIQAYVIPYFQAVRETLANLAGGGAVFKVGIYGSGLSCRLVKELAGLADFSWLAEATGWRESSTYLTWDVKQFVTDTDLCSIGNGWQRCDAKQSFGQFKPVGFDITNGEGEKRWVVATQLNLRAAPNATAEVFTQLPNNHLVRVLGQSTSGWIRVRTELHGAIFIGHVAEKYLTTQEPPASLSNVVVAVASIPPAVHMKSGTGKAKRAIAGLHAHPLDEVGQPKRNSTADLPTKVMRLIEIADWLQVTTSARYQPIVEQASGNTLTYCNVYAYDYCFLADIYLPRVWWTSKALMAIAKGETVVPSYGKTINELRADDLYQWLIDFGDQFGWRRVSDVNALQSAANAGGVGIICGDRFAPGRSGHITVVIPEDATHKATRDVDGNVLQPLQSQAGSKNYRWGSSGANWWKATPGYFKDFVFFVHE
jgi:Domain of unknown function (DUF1906)/Bacterial SH3 domain